MMLNSLFFEATEQREPLERFKDSHSHVSGQRDELREWSLLQHYGWIWVGKDHGCQG